MCGWDRSSRAEGGALVWAAPSEGPIPRAHHIIEARSLARSIASAGWLLRRSPPAPVGREGRCTASAGVERQSSTAGCLSVTDRMMMTSRARDSEGINYLSVT